MVAEGEWTQMIGHRYVEVFQSSQVDFDYAQRRARAMGASDTIGRDGYESHVIGGSESGKKRGRRQKEERKKREKRYGNCFFD